MTLDDLAALEKEALMKRIKAKVVIDPLTSCWLWQASKLPSGYGRFCFRAKDALVHRVSAMVKTGKLIPQGMHVDHLCKNPSCANPDHLEVVTPSINRIRSSSTERARLRAAEAAFCSRGHEWTAENTGYSSKGRFCRRCCLINQRKNVYGWDPVRAETAPVDAKKRKKSLTRLEGVGK